MRLGGEMRGDRGGWKEFGGEKELGVGRLGGAEVGRRERVEEERVEN